MKNIFKTKKMSVVLIALAVVLVLILASVVVYKSVNGVYAVEKQIDSMAELMSPTMKDIENFQVAYAKLSPMAKKFVSNYDTYLDVHNMYIENLIDAFSVGEAYNEFYDIVYRQLSNHVNPPTIELDRQNRVLNINVLAGPDTENQLINDPNVAQEYLQVVLEDMIYATTVGFDIASLYGLDVLGVVTTDENNGIEVIRVKNGSVESYIFATN